MSPPQHPDRPDDGAFIVGTGRCGSTLLTQMLRRHPEQLSVSELFAFISDLGNQIPRCFPPEPIDGDAFWAIVAGVHPRQNLLLRHGLRMPEVLYDFERGRFEASTGVPALALTTLPHLEADPFGSAHAGDVDGRLDELEAVVRGWGRAPAADHYRALLGWLTGRYGRRAWVERSGGTLRIVHRLIEQFPHARFVHIVRDGRNTALSMSRHIGFRMALIAFQLVEFLGVDPFEDPDRSEVDDLPDDLAALLPEHFDAEAFWAYSLPPALCGHYWSGEIIRGLEALDALPRDRVLTLSYERLLGQPREQLRILDAFLSGPEAAEQPASRAWIEGCLGLIGAGRSAWSELPERERRELEAACAPGFEALAARGVLPA